MAKHSPRRRPTFQSARLDPDDNVLTVWLDDGQAVDANILFTFNENGDQFLFYEIGDWAYAAKLNPDNSLAPLAADEWPVVEQIFNEWLADEPDDDADAD